MNPVRTQLLRAAKSINDAPFSGCCTAISLSCSIYVSGRCHCDKCIEVFNLFKRPRAKAGSYWFGPKGENRDERVLALLFAAAIAESHK